MGVVVLPFLQLKLAEKPVFPSGEGLVPDLTLPDVHQSHFQVLPIQLHRVDQLPS